MSYDRRCSDGFVVQGAWWLPDSPDASTVGTFTWDPEVGARLELPGFVPPVADPMDWAPRFLHGVADGDHFTLIGCHVEHLNFRVPGIPILVIRALGGCLVGDVLVDPAEARFDRLMIEIDHLAELSGRSSITGHMVLAPDGRTIASVVTEY